MDLIVSFQVADEGAVGFDDDLVFVAEVNDGPLLTPGV